MDAQCHLVATLWITQYFNRIRYFKLFLFSTLWWHVTWLSLQKNKMHTVAETINNGGISLSTIYHRYNTINIYVLLCMKLSFIF